MENKASILEKKVAEERSEKCDVGEESCVSVMINFTCQLDYTMRYPDIWPKIHYFGNSSKSVLGSD